MGRIRVLTFVAAGCILTPAPIQAQVFEYAAGSSSLLRARGGSVLVHGGDYSAYVGIGSQDNRSTPHVGLSFETTLRGLRWELGDRSIPLSLPTDVFRGSYAFMARGLAVGRTTSRSDLLLFGGATSSRFWTPYFQVGDARTPAGLIYYDRRLATRLRGFSRNVVSRRNTSIQGLEWTPGRGFKVGAAGGVGSAQPFASGSLELDASRLGLRATYARAASEFRRLPIDGFTSSEYDGANAELQFRPRRNIRLGVSHLHHAAQSSRGTLRSMVDAGNVGGDVLGIRVNASAYRSSGSRGYSLGAGRALFRACDVEGSYFRSDRPGARAYETFVARARQSVGPRLSLLQVVATGNGHTNLTWGGQLVSGRVSVSVDYQTTFLPFAPAGRSSFLQSMMFEVHLPLPGAARLHGTTQVDPLGNARYTAYATGFAYGRPITSRSVGPQRDAIAGNVIRGSVCDTTGTPVSGAALRIGDELVFSDSHGRVEVRKKKEGEYALVVTLDEFMFPGGYEVVSAPETVRAGDERGTPEFRVVLRRVR